MIASIAASQHLTNKVVLSRMEVKDFHFVAEATRRSPCDSDHKERIDKQLLWAELNSRNNLR